MKFSFSNCKVLQDHRLAANESVSFNSVPLL